VNTVGSLTVENCAIRNLTGSGTIGFGILFFANPGVLPAPATRLRCA